MKKIEEYNKIKKREMIEKLEKQKDNLASLKTKNRNLREILNSLPELIILFDQDYNYMEIWHTISGDLVAAKADLLGKNIEDVLPEGVVEKYIDNGSEALKKNEMVSFEYKLNINGNDKYFETQLLPKSLENYQKRVFLADIKNISRRKKAEKERREQKAYFEQLFKNSIEGIVLLDNNNRVMRVNKKFEEIFKYKESEIIGEDLDDLITPKEYGNEGRNYSNDVICGETVTDEVIRETKDGKKIHVSLHGFPIKLSEDQLGIYAVYNDISQRKKEEEKIKYLSFHDQLTGLYNRRYFENEIERLNHSRRLPIAIVVGDIDGLKGINDTYGHKKGDKYIEKISNIIEETTRTEDVVARIGGDEISIILPETGSSQAKKLCERIRNKCEEFNQTKNFPVSLSISLGHATTHKIEDDLNEVFKKADRRMYQNKGRKR
ncbi:MAG: diguanylate cyclase [bacterium]